MNKMIEKIKFWETLDFSENPYGEKLPDFVLDSKIFLTTGEPIRNQSQNGDILSLLYNDRDKTSPAEAFNAVLMAPVFKDLWDKDELCPSNYLVGILFQLTKYEFENSVNWDKAFIVKYLARALRAFASYLREKSLEEIVSNIFTDVANEKNIEIKIGSEDDMTEDLKNKTDILITLDGYKYRIWSFQATQSGCRMTAKRVLKSKKGINLYIPFNIRDRKTISGWFLYNPEVVKKNISNLKLEKFEIFKKKVSENNQILESCHKVLVR